MKKTISGCLIMVLLLILFSSCSNNEKDKLTLISNDKNYEVYEYYYNQFMTDYFFIIFDNKGEKLDAGYCGEHMPSIKKVNEFILEYSISFGTNAVEYKYYDVKNGLASEAFQNIYYCQDNKVAYVDYRDTGTYICYKEIFEESFLINEKLDMGGIMTTQFEVFIDKDILSVTHAKGKEYNEITEKFIIEEKRNEA